jgi:hypothetical protein
MSIAEINLINQLPKIEDRSPTLLEIGGYPHYENVLSNYLAFYFDPAREHGLKESFLKAWCETIGVSNSSDFPSVEVYREYSTDQNARIDLLIVTPSEVFCIENKIFHHAEHNPLLEYHAFVRKSYPNHTPHFAILSLDKVPKKITTGNEFKNITYQQFIKAIEANIQKYKLDDQQDFHYLFLVDLLQSIRNLSLKRNMQKETLQLIQQNIADFQKLSTHLTDLQKDMDARLLAVKKALEKPNEYPIRYSQIWLSGREDARKELKAVLFYTLDMEKENPKTELKIRLTPEGWNVELWNYQHNLQINEALQKRLVDGAKPKQKHFQLMNKPVDYFSSSDHIKDSVKQLLVHAGIITNT